MNKIQFKYVAGPFGDETSRYDITFPDMKVIDFIATVIKEKPGEWGYINLNSVGYNSRIAEYRHGVILSMTDDADLLNTTITCNEAWAHGGWSRMDYVLYGKVNKPKIVYPEPEEKPNFLF